jgi:hypothetical protein
MAREVSRSADKSLDQTDRLPVLPADYAEDPSVEGTAVFDTEANAVLRASALALELKAVRSELEAAQGQLQAADQRLDLREAAVEQAKAQAAEAVLRAKSQELRLRALQETHAEKVAGLQAESQAAVAAAAQAAAQRAGAAAAQSANEAAQRLATAHELKLRDLQTELAAARTSPPTAEAAPIDADRVAGRDTRELEAELRGVRIELGAAKDQAAAHVEKVRTREWRHAFQQNVFRELDATVAAQAQAIQQLRVAREQAAIPPAAPPVLPAEGPELARLAAQVDTLSAEVAWLKDELAAREAALAEAHAEVHAAVAIEATGPDPSIELHIRHLSQELESAAASLVGANASVDATRDENRMLRVALEQARSALEEQEFLIRRLERSAPKPAPKADAPPDEWNAKLVRVDGDRLVTHTLGKRTRIGRAEGCDLRLDVASVSRHHALLIIAPDALIIEDLNSTNGVYVNGRKVNRQSLSDGDMVTIGELQFRFSARRAAKSAARDQSGGS